MTIIPLDIRMAVVCVYAIAGAMLPAFALMKGRFSVAGLGLSALVAIATICLSIVGARQAKRHGVFLKFGPLGWYAVPHFSWAVGVASGALAAYASLPID